MAAAQSDDPVLCLYVDWANRYLSRRRRFRLSTRRLGRLVSYYRVSVGALSGTVFTQHLLKGVCGQRVAEKVTLCLATAF